MATFTVMMTHPDGEGWNAHLKPHVGCLLRRLEEGTLKASGPLRGMRLRSGVLVVAAADRAEVEATIADDPFSIENLIVGLAVTQWDPVFGAFHDISGGQLPGGPGTTG